MKKKSFGWDDAYIKEIENNNILMRENTKLEEKVTDLSGLVNFYFNLTSILLGILCGVIGHWFFSNTGGVGKIIDRYKYEAEKTNVGKIISRYNVEVEKVKEADDRFQELFIKAFFSPHEQYPAQYEFSNIISVGGINEDETMNYLSNYGSGVDSLAPSMVLSTYPDNNYAWADGTSSSAAVVTGALVLLKARYPNKPPNELIEIFKTCHRKPDALRDKSVFGVLDMSRCDIKEGHQ